MSNILKNYKKLPASAFRSKIFLGQDHLLCIFQKKYEEGYRRFYFKDIQAIITRRNRLDLLWNTVFVILSIIFLAISKGLWPLSAFFLSLILINWLRGPTCTCHIQTAVSKEKLPSLNRMKRALKVINQIIPFIEREQGKLEHDEIVSNIQKISEEVPSSEMTGSNSSSSDHAISSYSGKVHEALFYVFLLSGLTITLDLFFKSILTTVISSLVSSSLSILVVVAVVKQHGSALSNEVKNLTWASMVYLISFLISGYAGLMYFLFKNPVIAGNQWEIVKVMSSISAFDYPLYLGIYIVSIAFSFFAGIAGVFFIRKSKIS